MDQQRATLYEFISDIDPKSKVILYVHHHEIGKLSGRVREVGEDYLIFEEETDTSNRPRQIVINIDFVLAVEIS